MLQKLTPEDLLAGADSTFEVAIPPHILHPGENPKSETEDEEKQMTVQLRPLTIGTFQLILKATRNEPGLIPVLMVKESLVEPALSLEQVKRLHLGLIEFLIGQIRRISGLTEKMHETDFNDSPLVRASYLLAREFGWTPKQIQEMTMAQISIYLQMLKEEGLKRKDER